MLYGVYPFPEQIRESLLATNHYMHPDLCPFNMLVQGEEIELIDWDRKYGIRVDPEKGFNWIFYLLDITSPTIFRNQLSDHKLVDHFLR